MLPDANDFPTRCRERGSVRVVSSPVTRELALPVFAVLASRDSSMLWAEVPIAAVHEHSDLLTGESNVRSWLPRLPNIDWVVLAKSEAEAVKGTSQAQLR
jgi:hypothetical protein